MKTMTVLLLLGAFISGLAQSPSPERQQFIRVEAPVIALAHVRVIDGTGAAPRDDLPASGISPGARRSLELPFLNLCPPGSTTRCRLAPLPGGDRRTGSCAQVSWHWAPAGGVTRCGDCGYFRGPLCHARARIWHSGHWPDATPESQRGGGAYFSAGTFALSLSSSVAGMRA